MGALESHLGGGSGRSPVGEASGKPKVETASDVAPDTLRFEATVVWREACSSSAPTQSSVYLHPTKDALVACRRGIGGLIAGGFTRHTVLFRLPWEGLCAALVEPGGFFDTINSSSIFSNNSSI